MAWKIHQFFHQHPFNEIQLDVPHLLIIIIIYLLEYQFVEHTNHDCLTGTHTRQFHDQELCKKDCADDNDCGGIVLAHGKCFVKGLNCKEDLTAMNGAITYIKEKN